MSDRFSEAPLILRAYVVFASLAILLWLARTVPAIHEALIPYLGWNGFVFYAFSLYFAIRPSIGRDSRKMVKGVVVLLALGVLFGIVDTALHVLGRPDDYGNPYLAYHPTRPLFTIALPLLWLVLLTSPPMRRWTAGSEVQSDMDTQTA